MCYKFAHNNSYSVRISKDLLGEMRRYYDRMDPPKPTFSAILSHIVKMGWDSYMTRGHEGSKIPKPLVAPFPKRLDERTFKVG